MFELSLSPAISPSIAPILAVTTAGTSDFAQALADATGDASSLLRPALAEPLPPERQISAATALPMVDDASQGTASPPIILPRPLQVSTADFASASAIDAATITVDRPAAPNVVSRLPIVSTATAAQVDVAPPFVAKIARQPLAPTQRPAPPASPSRATADKAAPLAFLRPAGKPVGKGADQSEPIDRADPPDGVIEQIALPPAIPVFVAVPVQVDNASTPPRTAPTTAPTTVPTPAATPTVHALAPAPAQPLSSVGTSSTPIVQALATVQTAIITPAAVAVGPVENAIPLPVEVSPRPAVIDPPTATTLLPVVLGARPVDRDSPKPAVAARADAIISAIPAPLPLPLIGVPVSALRAFAAAIAATNAPAVRPPRDDEPLIPSSTVSVLPEAAIRQADPPARPLPPIDMQQEDWTRALIDRIDAVRDVANARDTRITLVPDALGKIDVALRQEGETLHVSFAADAPATRALLADAQPRLAELAEARGLKLGDTAVSARSDQQSDRAASGFGQSADQRRPVPAPQGTASNRTNTISPAQDRADSDHRIA